MGQQTDDPNVQKFTAAADGSEVDRFYGCWLDINQSQNNVLPMVVPPSDQDGPFNLPAPFQPLPIQQAILRNPHQCLIAEIAFDPVAIPPGKDPGNWDKLAQRNLAWSDIPNPGRDGSRRALDTFEIRPTPRGLRPEQPPDELMIDWGNVPEGASAQIYLPAINSVDVLSMADKMYSTHRLKQLDDHTLECRTGGFTYFPIPAGGAVNYAGLLSIDLPPTVKKGQSFHVVVRQVTSAFGAFGRRPSSSPQRPATQHALALQQSRKFFEWRKVLGAFQLNIPVKTKDALVVPEERLLSVLRWIFQAIPPHNRWYPVFSRYLEEIGGRVHGLGGDPSKVPPSPTGDPEPKHRHHRGDEDEERERREEREAATGKIAGLIFDRFGDFEGFLLDTEDGERRFFSREKEIEELAEQVWRERLRITVRAERDEPHRPLSIIVREPPAPFRP
jgi:hypothetical protein